MELMVGFKQTEAGVIPAEWDARSLRDLCKEPITYGIVQCGPDVKDGVPYVRVSDMDGPRLDVERMLRTSPAIAARFSRSTVQDGDLVYALRGKIGEVRVVRPPVVGANLTQGTARLSPKDDIASDYFQWAMRSSSVVKRGELEAKGTTFREITLTELRRVLVPVPPLLEQRAIAKALSDVDTLVDELTRLIAKKRDIKQAAMQQFLGAQTPLHGSNAEWKLASLGSVAEVKTGPFGSTLHESDYVDVGTPIITVEHLGEFGVEYTNLPLVSEKDRARLSAYSLREGDIVFSRVGSIDRNALIRSHEAGWLFSGRLLRVRPDGKTVHPPFLSYQFHSDPFKSAVRTVAVGQTMASLNTRILEGIRVMLPPLAEQITIAQVLSDMDTEIAALEARRDKTRALKQAMMQELLTGKTRLV
jgi:type I restriction enzyme S subunit